MSMHPASTVAAPGYTAFLGHRRIASGAADEVARRVAWHRKRTPDAPLLVFDDATGVQTELDPRPAGSEALGAPASDDPSAGRTAAARAPGRPRLGVIAREVTLLPRHWEWLGAQPGGASVALRRLVDDARRARAGQDLVRASQERTYRFLHAIAGDLPHYEGALRALFGGRRSDFGAAMADWPADIRAHARRLAEAAWTA
jgi:hypothetical protein